MPIFVSTPLKFIRTEVLKFFKRFLEIVLIFGIRRVCL